MLCYTAPADEQSAVVCGKLLGTKLLEESERSPETKRAGTRLKKTLSFSRLKRGASAEKSIQLALETDQRVYELRVDSAEDAAAWHEACLRVLASK